MPYRLDITKSADKALKKTNDQDKKRLDAAISDLAEEPRPNGYAAMQGTPGLYRVRVGGYRVVYRVDDDEEVVTVAFVGNRRDIYRKARRKKA